MTGGRVAVAVVGGVVGTAVGTVVVVVKNAVATTAEDALGGRVTTTGGRIGTSIRVPVVGSGTVGVAVATAIGDELGGRVTTTDGGRIDCMLLFGGVVTMAVGDVLGGRVTTTHGRSVDRRPDGDAVDVRSCDCGGRVAPPSLAG